MPKHNNSNSKKKSIKKSKSKSNKKNVKQSGNKNKNKNISNEKKSNSNIKKDKKNKIQQGGSDSCRKSQQPLRPRLYNKAQSSNLLEDYPNAPPFPPDFLDDCVIM
jgi:hypothetical protein